MEGLVFTVQRNERQKEKRQKQKVGGEEYKQSTEVSLERSQHKQSTERRAAQQLTEVA